MTPHALDEFLFQGVSTSQPIIPVMVISMDGILYVPLQWKQPECVSRGTESRDSVPLETLVPSWRG